MRRRRTAAALLSALILVLAGPGVTPARAEGLFFVAVEDTVQPLTDATMPFWSGGHLYIASDLFAVPGGGLGISRILNVEKGMLVLYTVGESLVFELEGRYARDDDGVAYYPGALWHNGVCFVPVTVVCSRFGLRYSTTEVEQGQLIWLRQSSFRLQDRDFARAVSSQLDAVYQTYIHSLEPAPEAETDTEPESGLAEIAAEPEWNPPDIQGNAVENTSPVPSSPPVQESPARPARTVQPTVSNPPSVPEPSADPEPEEPLIAGKQDVYLCFRAGSGTSALLDVLDRNGVRAAFFCEESFLQREGDLLRRMEAAGHSIGILADDAAAVETCNRLLERAVCRKTRLVMTADGEAGEGSVLFQPMLDSSTAPVRTAAGGRALLLSVSRYRGPVSVWLGDTVAPAGLEAFTAAALGVRDRLWPLTETSFL